jgi:large subunit ribosomal protein L22
VQNAQYLADERGLDVDVDKLYVKTAVANDGPRMKRIRPAPMGRAFRYQRRIAHIVITIAEKKAAEVAATATTPVAETTSKPAAKKAAARKAPAKKAAAKKTAAKKSAPKKKAAAK